MQNLQCVGEGEGEGGRSVGDGWQESKEGWMISGYSGG